MLAGVQHLLPYSVLCQGAMNPLTLDDLLNVSQHYNDEKISVRTLEEAIHAERQRQNVHVDRLNAMRERNGELQSALSEEVDKLRALSEELASRRQEPSAWRKLVSKLPFVTAPDTSKRSIEELLRRQYEISALRVKEAAEFADRLDAAKQDLYDEIERLNRRIIDYAQNEKSAALHVIRLSEMRTEFEMRLRMSEQGSLQWRETRAQLDRATRALAEHSAMLKLFATAENRLARLQENTRMLSKTITQLQADITTYVTIGSEKLDLIAGQIQAIGAAADASMVMLELKQSLEAMTESVNYTTRFVSETQAYFRSNVDQMVDDLQLYDSETEGVLQGNLALNQVYDDMQVAEAISIAMEQKIALDLENLGEEPPSSQRVTFEQSEQIVVERNEKKR